MRLLLVQNLELELSKDLLLEVEVLQLALEAVSRSLPEAVVSVAVPEAAV